jgi:hypothetical protein
MIPYENNIQSRRAVGNVLAFSLGYFSPFLGKYAQGRKEKRGKLYKGRKFSEEGLKCPIRGLFPYSMRVPSPIGYRRVLGYRGVFAHGAICPAAVRENGGGHG